MRLQPLLPDGGTRHRPGMSWNLWRQILPGCCLLCEGPLPAHADLDLCRHCAAALPRNEPACPRCAEPGVTGLCGRCRQRPPPFARTVAPLLYRDCAAGWVTRLKDHVGMVEGRLLGTLLAEAAARLYGSAAVAPRRPDLLIPVPLTRRRLARRGHNQALTLARPVSRRLDIPVLRHAVVRTGPGPAQRGLSRTRRLHNPGGTFACPGSCGGRPLWPSAPCVAIVDDVMTTGATSAELARVLLSAGAGEVHVLCATRTPAP